MNSSNLIKALRTAVVCLLLTACSKISKDSPTKQVENLLRNGRAETALSIANQHLRTHPQALNVARLRILVLLKLHLRNEAMEALQQFPANDPVWLKALTYQDEDVRIGAADLIAHSKQLPISVDKLIRALEDPSPEVRRCCVQALGHQPASVAIKPLVDILGDDNWYVRAEAVTALGEMREQRVVAWIVYALTDGDAFVRYRAFKALEQMPLQQTRTLLLNHLHELRGPGNYALALALAKLEDASAIPILQQILSTSDANMRLNIAHTLIDIPAPIAKELLEVLAKDNDSRVKKAASQTLKKLHTPIPPPPSKPAFTIYLTLS